jgi:hypothetical protein
MPTETAIVIAAIVLVFAVFGVALAWADYYTRNFRAPGATYFHAPDAEERNAPRPASLAAPGTPFSPQRG